MSRVGAKTGDALGAAAEAVDALETQTARIAVAVPPENHIRQNGEA